MYAHPPRVDVRTRSLAEGSESVDDGHLGRAAARAHRQQPVATPRAFPRVPPRREQLGARRTERVQEGNRYAFGIHATVFIAVNVLLIAIWAMVWQLSDGTSYPGFVFVLLGWGIGLAAQWAATRKHLRR